MAQNSDFELFSFSTDVLFDRSIRRVEYKKVTGELSKFLPVTSPQFVDMSNRRIEYLHDTREKER